MEKQGTADGAKTPNQTGSAKKGVKRANDEEESPVKKPRKTPAKGAKVKDEEAKHAAEDGGEGEERA